MNDEGSKRKHEGANPTGVRLAVTLALDGRIARWGRGAAEEGIKDDAGVRERRGRDGPQGRDGAGVGHV
jgi:hypothetical protein